MDAMQDIASASLAALAGRQDPERLARGAAAGGDIAKVAQDFEAMAIGELLRPMFEGLSTDGPFGGGQGEAVFRSLLTDEYAKAIAKAGGIGLAEPVARELLAIQEQRR